MAAYATMADVQARMTRELSADELAVGAALLDDAALLIDAAAPEAASANKAAVSCRMVIRALGDGSSGGYPIGATQGSMSALGYSQSWTVSGGGGTGELYLSKSDRQLLGCGHSIGSYSPVQELAPQPEATT